MTNLTEVLKKKGACIDGLNYIEGKKPKNAWDKSNRGDWMLWAAQKLGVDDKKLISVKIKCIKTIGHLIVDEDLIKAVNDCEDYVSGMSDIKIVNDQFKKVREIYSRATLDNECCFSKENIRYYVAYAVYSITSSNPHTAVYSALAAASESKEPIEARSWTLNLCANICRDSIPFNSLNIR